MRLIRNILKKHRDTKREAAIEALRLIDAANRGDRAFIKSLYDRSVSALNRADDLLRAFIANPSDETADAYVKAVRSGLDDSRAYTLLHQKSVEPINQRIVERTREPLRAALEAILQAADIEFAAQQRAADEEERTTGLPAAKSPLRDLLENTIQACKAWLGRIDRLRADETYGAVSLVLDDGLNP